MEGKSLETLRNQICKARGYTKGNDEPCVYQDLLEDNDTMSALSVTNEVLELVNLNLEKSNQLNADLEQRLKEAAELIQLFRFTYFYNLDADGFPKAMLSDIGKLYANASTFITNNEKK